MKTNRRWLQSVIKAAAKEEVFLPWAMAKVDKNTVFPITALHFTAPQTPAAPRLYTRVTAAR